MDIRRRRSEHLPITQDQIVIASSAPASGRSPWMNRVTSAPLRHGRALARRRTGVLPNALCPDHPRRPMAPQSPILSAPCRLSVWAACKPDHVDGRDKPGHDGKCHGNQRLTRLFLVSDSEAIQTVPRLETPSLDRFALLAMTDSAKRVIPGENLGIAGLVGVRGVVITTTLIRRFAPPSPASAGEGFHRAA